MDSNKRNSTAHCMESGWGRGVQNGSFTQLATLQGRARGSSGGGPCHVTFTELQLSGFTVPTPHIALKTRIARHYLPPLWCLLTPRTAPPSRQWRRRHLQLSVPRRRTTSARGGRRCFVWSGLRSSGIRGAPSVGSACALSRRYGPIHHCRLMAGVSDVNEYVTSS